MTDERERLDWRPVQGALDLVAPPVAEALRHWHRARDVQVAPIDPSLADTAAFCAHYDVELEESANCVIVAARRGERTTLAACMVLATMRLDVNNAVRRRLDARKASFAPMDQAVSDSQMEYGGITPIGVPDDWPILVDAAVAATPSIVLGSGRRASKLRVPGAALVHLAGAEVSEGLAVRSAG